MASCMRGCWGVFSEEIRKLRRPAHIRGRYLAVCLAVILSSVLVMFIFLIGLLHCYRTYRRARYSEKELSIEVFKNFF